MKNIFFILKNLLKNSPYLLLIGIYFFFVNLEARKDKKDNQNSQQGLILTKNESINKENKIRIKIPVIPYKQ